ncbi:protein C10-like protein [Dinothrombium tinctorium]|uniref:Protein C10 n=1 Tax=Dinothrombium tinctorium TaxID=1965070 RepID=A0A3S4R4U0_9ACAR|nr:protein C10-like protein [Dinothrombium tinctorium]
MMSASQKHPNDCTQQSKSENALTTIEVKNILKQILNKLSETTKTDECQEMDALSQMQHTFPAMTETIAATINEYGFPRNGEGVIQFILLAKQKEIIDKEIRDLNFALKNILLPQSLINYKTESQ